MGGHPAGVPKHPHGAGGHPVGIPKGHPEGVLMGDYPGDVETTRAHGTVGHSPFKKNI